MKYHAGCLGNQPDQRAPHTPGGTNDDDTIITDFGDDGIWGGAGNDRIESGAGVDLVLGGAGDDIITDSGDTGDFLKGEEGNDVIANSNGLDILMGGDGQDVIFVGVDDTEVFGGTGTDFILGGDGVDFLLGNEGDDWIEGGGGFDTTAGDNSELFFNSTILGHDVMFAGSEEHDFDAESGDDIMVQGASVMRNMLGFDWSIHKGNTEAADSDLLVPIFTTDQADILRDRFDAVEALSGWDKNDVLRGDNRGDAGDGGVEPGTGLAGAENTMVGHELTHGGIDRINGLRALIGNLADPVNASSFEGGVAFDDGNILLGGGGSDTIERQRSHRWRQLAQCSHQHSRSQFAQRDRICRQSQPYFCGRPRRSSCMGREDAVGVDDRSNDRAAAAQHRPRDCDG